MSRPKGESPKSDPPPTEAPEEPVGTETEVPEAAPSEGSVPKPTSEKPESPNWERNYRYLLADFENFRKRVEREKEQAVYAAQGKLLLKILDLHEGIERVAEGLPKEAQTIREGLQLLLKNVDALLRSEQVEALGKVGETFRTETHEAVGTIPAPPGVEPGRVAVVVQRGYQGPGGLLRPAKILLAGPPAPAEDETPAEERPAE